MPNFRIGDKVKDTVTGYTGIAVCKTEWLNGCNRWGIQPDTLGKDGKPQGIEMVDEPQLVLVKSMQPKRENSTGGPRDSRIETARR